MVYLVCYPNLYHSLFHQTHHGMNGNKHMKYTTVLMVYFYITP